MARFYKRKKWKKLVEALLASIVMGLLIYGTSPTPPPMLVPCNCSKPKRTANWKMPTGERWNQIVQCEPWTPAHKHTHTILLMLEDLLQHNGTDAEVLCMHHLGLDRSQTWVRACGIKFEQVMWVLNPRIVGGSNDLHLYEERSIACNGPNRVWRMDSIVLEWDRWPDGAPVHVMLSGALAVGMQIAIDEMEGTHKHCITSLQIESSGPPLHV